MPQTTMTFTDTRPDVLGADLELSQAVLTDVCKAAGLPDFVSLTIEAIPFDPNVEGNHAGVAPVIESEDPSVFPDAWKVFLPVEDRLDFSTKAIERINRNLIHALRHIAQYHFLVESEFFITKEAGVALYYGARSLMEQEAYMVERTVKENPSLWAITANPAPLAENPNDKS